MVHSRSIWAPAFSDLFMSMRYGVSSRGRYGRYGDDPDELGLIRIEAGRGAPGKGRALIAVEAIPGSGAKDGVFDTVEPRGNGRTGGAGDLHSGSEWSMSDEDSPREQHVGPVGGGNAAKDDTFVATFLDGTHATAGASESSSVAGDGKLVRPN